MAGRNFRTTHAALHSLQEETTEQCQGCTICIPTGLWRQPDVLTNLARLTRSYAHTNTVAPLSCIIVGSVNAPPLRLGLASCPQMVDEVLPGELLRGQTRLSAAICQPAITTRACQHQRRRGISARTWQSNSLLAHLRDVASAL